MTDLERLIAEFATNIERLFAKRVRATLMEAVGLADSGPPQGLVSGRAMMVAHESPAGRKVAKHVRVKPTADRTAEGKPRQHKRIMCAVCGKPAAGPKYGWRCREHGAAVRRQQQRAAKKGR